MAYTITQWKKCVSILKETPNIPTVEIVAKLDSDFDETALLIEQVCSIWNIKRVAEKPKTRGTYKNHL